MMDSSLLILFVTLLFNSKDSSAFSIFREKRTVVDCLDDPLCTTDGNAGSITSAAEHQSNSTYSSDDLSSKSAAFERRKNGGSAIRPIGLDIIYPGTKWCGAGDVADHYWDLGQHIETDKCCRDHDFCDDVIPAKSCAHGLCNNTPFTRSHCDCDEKFRQCLLNSQEPASKSVGMMFFDVGALSCFRLESPTKAQCTTYLGPMTYDLNTPIITREQNGSSQRWCFIPPLPFK